MTVRKCTKYNEEFRLKALKIVEEDSRSIPEIAESLGVNRHTLRNWVHDKKKSPKAVREYSEEVREAAVTLVTKEGFSPEKTAQKLKVPKVLVEYWIYENKEGSVKEAGTSKILQLQQEVVELKKARERLKEINSYLLDQIA